MAMPLDLVLVRHGQSEGNVAVHASKRGDESFIEREGFRERHSSWWRLTGLGVEQAQLAGQWIQTELGPEFDRYYVSAYTRALETAANLRLPEARWFIDPNLRERERGREDLLSAAERELAIESARERASTPFYWRPLNGESIAAVCIRVRDFCSTLHREVSDGKVLIVCHGEVMEAFRVVLERMTHYDYAEWTNSDDPRERIHNGQVFHFTRRHPQTGEVSDYPNWWRSISTSDLSLCDPRWREIRRPRFSNADLLSLVERTPRLID